MSKFLTPGIFCGICKYFIRINSENMASQQSPKFDLEERLIEFAVRIIEVAETLPKTLAGKHIGSQIVRSGTSPALNYVEAQAAHTSSRHFCGGTPNSCLNTRLKYAGSLKPVSKAMAVMLKLVFWSNSFALVSRT